MMARHYVLRGRVQGVGFRYFVYKVAGELGVAGWVRNLVNGDVEIHAEGDEESMTQFLNRIKTGPSLSIVNDIRVSEVDPQDYADFNIEG